MTPELSDFIPDLLTDTQLRLIPVDGIFHRKKTGKVQIKMRDDNGKPFIDTLYNLLLAPDLCDLLFSIIMLMNSGYTCFSHKGF